MFSLAFAAASSLACRNAAGMFSPCCSPDGVREGVSPIRMWGVEEVVLGGAAAPVAVGAIATFCGSDFEAS